MSTIKKPEWANQVQWDALKSDSERKQFSIGPGEFRKDEGFESVELPLSESRSNLPSDDGRGPEVISPWITRVHIEVLKSDSNNSVTLKQGDNRVVFYNYKELEHILQDIHGGDISCHVSRVTMGSNGVANSIHT